MDGILQALHEVEGVQATLVMDAGGQLLAHRAHAVYDGNLLQEVGRTIANAMDSLRLVHDDWEMVTANYSEGKILIRNLVAGRAAPGGAVALALVADARLNPSFAGVAMRVAAGRIKNGVQTAATMAAAAPPSAPVRPVTAPSLAAVPAPSRPVTAPVPVAAPAARTSGFQSAVTLSGASDDPRAAAFLVACTRALAGSVGRMAKVFVKEAIGRVCAGEPFGREHAAPLLAELEKHVDDPVERAQFRKAAASG